MNAQLSRSLFLSCPNQNRSTIRIVILTIVGLHAGFFLVLLALGYQHGQTTLLSANGSASASGQKLIQASILPIGAPTAEMCPALAAESSVEDLKDASLPARQISVASDQAQSDVEHTVVAGDTLARIAKQRHISVSAVLEANPQVNPAKLKIGQKIQIPAG